MDGDYWTKWKLDRIEAHLPVFTREVGEKRFRTLYVDAFAGDGMVYFKEEVPSTQFTILSTKRETTVHGSAYRALAVDPPFDRYLLNDKNATNCQELKKLRRKFPVLADRVFVRRRDANEFVLDVWFLISD